MADPHFGAVTFDAGNFYASAGPVWSWTVEAGSVIYYRTARDGDIVTVQFYIEQGSVIADDGEQGVGPTDLIIEFPSGMSAVAAQVQASFTYTVDPNYAVNFDGLVSVGPYSTNLKLNRFSGRWPLGTNFAAWGEITFPVEPIA